MRLQDLNWMDVERYLEQDDRIILITGATEQHAYLSLLTDILIPEKISDAIVEQETVLIAPPLNFGVSELFVDYPGTLSIGQDTFEQLVLEIVDCLVSQGFGGFFIFNGHGGNQPIARLDDMQLDGVIRYYWYDWWRGEAARQFEEAHNMRIDHANWGENFPFNRVSRDIPVNDVKTSVNLEDLTLGKTARSVIGDGTFSGRYQIDDILMMQLFDAVVKEATGLVQQLRPN